MDNVIVAVLTFQDKSTFSATFLWYFLSESSNYFKESQWLSKYKVLSIRNMLWTFTVCQTPGDAEIIKTNISCKTKSFHTFEEVTYHQLGLTQELSEKTDLKTLDDRGCEADDICSPQHHGFCPLLMGGYRHCFQNSLTSSPEIIYDFCSKKTWLWAPCSVTVLSNNQQATHPLWHMGAPLFKLSFIQ